MMMMVMVIIIIIIISILRETVDKNGHLTIEHNLVDCTWYFIIRLRG